MHVVDHEPTEARRSTTYPIPCLLTEQHLATFGETSHVRGLVHHHADVVHTTGGDISGAGWRSSVNAHLYAETAKHKSSKVVTVLFRELVCQQLLWPAFYQELPTVRGRKWNESDGYREEVN
jgi:hypothetical protein